MPAVKLHSPYTLDREIASRAVAFFEQLLMHSKGEWAGSAFELQVWQKDLIAKAFGTVHRGTKRRRYRRVFGFLPRKNGKSTLGAGVANKMLFSDGEPGAEIYSAASDRTQAAIVFNEAKSM